MEDIYPGHEARDGEEEEEEVTAQEVGGEERHLDDLDDVLSCRLRECGGSKSSSVP